jgi:hypothetical protein
VRGGKEEVACVVLGRAVSEGLGRKVGRGEG